MEILNLNLSLSSFSLSHPIADIQFFYAAALSFSPIRLISLVIWVYICLYLIQRVQLSPLISERYKPIAYLITLFTGPLLLFMLLIMNRAKKSHHSDKDIFKATIQLLQNAVAKIPSRSSFYLKDDQTIKLLDSSGRNINEIYGNKESKRQKSHILDLTVYIIDEALKQRASDILIDPKDEAIYTVRLRIDGVLRTMNKINVETCKAVVNSIKAVGGMDISEKRRPQDGAFIAKKGEMIASFRVASAGVINGEKLAVRILNQNASSYKLADTGITKKQYSLIHSAIDKPSGMVLLCGPTGSGKTTTMYAMLNEIDRFTRNVITVEDPIEAVLPTASQIEINPKADITFAKSLRSILRQDPDVICVGEIRDEETAEIALRAAQTGHLVLATIHCDNNRAALIRLIDLGVSPVLLMSGLSLLCSQRLVRKLCEHCKEPVQISQNLRNEFEKVGLEYKDIFEATGCRRCNKTGYFGRTAVCDILTITDELKAGIIDSEGSVAEFRTTGGIKIKSKLRKEGLKKVAAGITSLEELKRVVG